MRTAFLAAALVALGLGLAGCPDPCGCGDPPAPVAVELAYCDLEVALIDNGGEWPVVSDARGIPRAAIGLELVLRSREALCVAPTWDNPFVSVAYACTCPEFGGFEVAVLDTIAAVSIRSTARYNEVYGPGDDLAELFRVELGYREYVGLEAYLADDHAGDLTYDAGVADAPNGQRLRLFAAEAADPNRELSFAIAVTLSDGRVLEAVTRPFEAQ